MFESLVMVERFQWPFWIPSDSFDVDEPLKIVYRRRHHREHHMVGSKKDGWERKYRELGDRSCALRMNIHFEQLNLKLKPIQLGIIVANKINAL